MQWTEVAPPLLTNGLVSLGSEERNLLSTSYPATDFDKCLIIQEGREPAGAGQQILMIGGGILLCLAAWALWVSASIN